MRRNVHQSSSSSSSSLFLVAETIVFGLHSFRERLVSYAVCVPHTSVRACRMTVCVPHTRSTMCGWSDAYTSLRYAIACVRLLIGLSYKCRPARAILYSNTAIQPKLSSLRHLCCLAPVVRQRLQREKPSITGHAPCSTFASRSSRPFLLLSSLGIWLVTSWRWPCWPRSSPVSRWLRQ
jgi:hypothetical protein